jgi:allantoinase
MAALPSDYPRDLSGYGRRLPDPKWPGNARIAVQIALNLEAGSELNLLHGDDRSEELLTDTGFPTVLNARSVLVESAFEFGSRRGVWRVLRLFQERQIRVSAFCCVSALPRIPEIAAALIEAGHEIVAHAWRWIDYQSVPEAVEREHIRQAVAGVQQLIGSRKIGWMTGRPSPNTRRLLVEHGQILYDRDALNDELPYWVSFAGKPHLVIPYSYESNDNRCNEHRGFKTSEDFFAYLKDAFDVLYEEGAEEPRMMSLGLHDRLIGRPGRAAGLARFLEYIQSRDRVWICRGDEIAQHWMAHHTYRA